MDDDPVAADVPSPAAVLQAQLEHAWSTTAWVLEELDEEAYSWEPVPGCWSVRRREDATAGWGAAAFVCEDTWPQPDPVPVTTVAWRVIHLAAWNDIYVDRAFGAGTLDLNDMEIPGDMAGGLAWLERSRQGFTEAVGALDGDDVFERRPVHWGERLPIVHIVTSMIAENVHHIAEVGVLRDLHRGRARRQPFPDRVGPPWWLGEPDRA